MLAVTSDYVEDTGDASPYLERIARAGFTHVHWCHHWNTDFLYSPPEISQVARWFKQYGLALLNLHGSHGREKYWCSPLEYQRLAGVELVKNRIDMTARLGADVVIMHVPSSLDPLERVNAIDPVRRSMDQILPFAHAMGVRIAVENMESDDFDMLATLLNEYDPAELGLCYDSGHGNIDGRGLDNLEKYKNRLIAVHLHDNDGHSDQHAIPFTGSVDWPRLATILASSAYVGPINLEVIIDTQRESDEDDFLRRAYLAGQRLTAMVTAS